MLSIIVAIDQNNGIGRNNQLLCHLPDDMKYFKRVTSGHTVVMGRKTYESLTVKPLPNRDNIVVSRSMDSLSGCRVVHSIEEAIQYCDDECFVIGGAQIYEQALPLAQKLYVTRIHHRFDADVFFPQIDPAYWQLQSSEPHNTDEKHLYPFTFEVYTRIG